MDIDLTTLKKNDKKKDTSNQKWTKEQEELLASWSERAAGYRWNIVVQKSYIVVEIILLLFLLLFLVL